MWPINFILESTTNIFLLNGMQVLIQLNKSPVNLFPGFEEGQGNYIADK